ncbi:MAG: hypothetical protein HY012_06040 [Acidobacteria bacterium]|nr:hypothetical protein [Acidobacteriota bacterium]
MKSTRRVVLFTAICLALVLSAAAETKIVKRWVITGMPVPTLNRILVVGLTENYIVRQYFEDEMERLLPKEGAVGIKSQMVLPPKDEMTQEEVIRRIHESKLDAVMIVRPKGIRKEEEYFPPSWNYIPNPTYMGLGPYWGYAYGAVYTPGYMEQYTIARVEVNIYGAHDDKLIWSGLTDAFLKRDMEKVAKDFAKTMVKQMKKDKLLPKK